MVKRFRRKSFNWLGPQNVIDNNVFIIFLLLTWRYVRLPQFKSFSLFTLFKAVMTSEVVMTPSRKLCYRKLSNSPTLVILLNNECTDDKAVTSNFLQRSKWLVYRSTWLLPDEGDYQWIVLLQIKYSNFHLIVTCNVPLALLHHSVVRACTFNHAIERYCAPPKISNKVELNEILKSDVKRVIETQWTVDGIIIIKYSMATAWLSTPIFRSTHSNFKMKIFRPESIRSRRISFTRNNVYSRRWSANFKIQRDAEEEVGYVSSVSRALRADDRSNARQLFQHYYIKRWEIDVKACCV